MLIQRSEMDERMGRGFALGALADSGIYGLELYKKHGAITERERKLIQKGLGLIKRLQEGLSVEPEKLTFKKLYSYKSAKSLESEGATLSEVIPPIDKLQEVEEIFDAILKEERVSGEKIEMAQKYLDLLSERYIRVSFETLHKIKDKYGTKHIERAVQR